MRGVVSPPLFYETVRLYNRDASNNDSPCKQHRAGRRLCAVAVSNCERAAEDKQSGKQYSDHHGSSFRCYPARDRTPNESAVISERTACASGVSVASTIAVNARYFIEYGDVRMSAS